MAPATTRPATPRRIAGRRLGRSAAPAIGRVQVAEPRPPGVGRAVGPAPCGSPSSSGPRSRRPLSQPAAADRRSSTTGESAHSAQRPPPRKAAASPRSSSRRSSWLYLADAVAARRCAGLDLAAVGGHGEVGDRRVLGLAAAVAHHRACSRCAVASSTVSSVSVRVPIWLTLTRTRVGDAAVDALLQAAGVGDEQVVADELDAVADAPPSARPSPSQSSSAMPSSIDTIGYVSTSRRPVLDQLVAARAPCPRRSRW